MKIKRWLWLIPVLCCCLAGCGQVVVDWADFLKLNGVSYTGDWQTVIVDASSIGEPVGEVKFELAASKHKNNSRYKTKDGDAAFLPAGTRVFAIKGVSDHSLVAAAVDGAFNGYRVYRQDQRAPVELQAKDVASIQLYEVANPNVLHGKHVRTIRGGDIPAFLALFDQAVEDRSAGPDRNLRYVVVYELPGGLGIQHRLVVSGDRYYVGHTEAKLPDAIRAWLRPE
ncbi:hypothetical protein ACFFNY_26370 [Paenibacillus hodogayensis]|uniref:Lipoprotein n=1 Tax=Paenibacillus hodogayensis TaxID=279208 RepID=A0ABV5W3F9_9BACL